MSSASPDPVAGPGDPFIVAGDAAQELARRTGRPNHDLFVVLGSGWAHVADLLPAGTDVAMTDLPGFPAPSAAGHGGHLRSLEVNGLRVLLALGRVHLYEGHPARVVAHGVRTAHAAGCNTVILTNAAGILNPDWPLGRPIIITDHINLTGSSPLEGLNPQPPMQGRFTDMSTTYTPSLRELARRVEPSLPEGVYLGVRGPQFETPAEIHMGRVMGASLVGMSTVMEAIAASHLRMQILGLSLATNLAAGLSPVPLDGDHIVAVARENAPWVADLLLRLITALAAQRTT
jgi:purine-nucleoside phosphorylase